MAYDEALAQRIRELMREESSLTEKHMFGGLAFLLSGNMAVAASGEGGLLLRIDPEETEYLLAEPRTPHGDARKINAGWLRVADEDVQTTDQLRPWVRRAYLRPFTAPK